MFFRTIVLLPLFLLHLISLNVPRHWNDDLTQTTTKDKAFTVLQAKCNFCHAVKKRTDVFTFENMDSLAVEINKQVFIKRKMPKGRKVTLTHEEEENLKDWIALTLIGNR